MDPPGSPPAKGIYNRMALSIAIYFPSEMNVLESWQQFDFHKIKFFFQMNTNFKKVLDQEGFLTAIKSLYINTLASIATRLC